MGKAGIREVADAVGVSVSTVSRSFTRPDLVSKATRAKVLAAADLLDFNISRSATALKSGQSYRVALLMNEGIDSWFNTQVFAGLESVLHDVGYDISLFQHIDSAEVRRQFFTALPIRRNVDAVFVASFAIDPHEVEQLKRIHVPIIGINTPSTASFDASISIDDEQGMFIATRHLLNLGHRRIVYICQDSIKTINSSMDRRREGFIRACTAAQHTGGVQWQIISIPRDRPLIDYALTSLLSMGEFPDAICCQMDRIAVPLMLKLQRYGHMAPDGYSIVGFDGTPESDLINLTTIRQNPRDMGRVAAAKALELIDGAGALDMPHETAETPLILRGTDSLYSSKGIQ